MIRDWLVSFFFYRYCSEALNFVATLRGRVATELVLDMGNCMGPSGGGGGTRSSGPSDAWAKVENSPLSANEVLRSVNDKKWCRFITGPSG